jgi:hypothetical protein
MAICTGYGGKMTREYAKELWPIIKAYGDGAEIEAKEQDGIWKTVGTPTWVDWLEYRIKPEPAKRPMTRGEVLYMVTTTPGMIVHHADAEDVPACKVAFYFPIEEYEYAIIDSSGNTIDGWHKFEKEVNND